MAENLAPAKGSLLRYLGQSYFGNARNTEPPWYAEMCYKLNSLVATVPCTVVAPQLSIQTVIELDENDDPIEDDEADDEDGGRAAADPDSSIGTEDGALAEYRTPDFCVIAGHCQPVTGLRRVDRRPHRRYFFDHIVHKSRIVAIVECKRLPQRSLPARKFARAVDAKLFIARTQSLNQAAILFRHDPSVKKVHLIASSGHYWNHVLLKPNNLSADTGGPNAEYVDKVQELRWSRKFELGTPRSDAELASLATALAAMQEELAAEA